MRFTHWAYFKIAFILALTIPVVAYRLDSIDDAHALGMAVGIGLIFLALFQFAVWLIYDIVTLRRGGWHEFGFGHFRL